MIELEVNMAINNRDITQAYLNRGYIRSNHMDLDGALADFDKAIQLDPNDADAYFKRGRAFLIVGNASFAIADFDKSISIDDQLLVCRTRFRSPNPGESNAAKKDFERGLKLNNDLRLMLDIIARSCKCKSKERQRRQAALKKNIA